MRPPFFAPSRNVKKLMNTTFLVGCWLDMPCYTKLGRTGITSERQFPFAPGTVYIRVVSDEIAAESGRYEIEIHDYTLGSATTFVEY